MASVIKLKTNIQNLSEIWSLIKSDYVRYYGYSNISFFRILHKALFSNEMGFRYSFWLRFCSRSNPFSRLAYYFHNKLSILLGVYIPGCTIIGYGFYIGHPVSIVINGRTIIGNNVNIGQMLSIGSNKDTPAIIGDDVYIGPSVCIVENVKVGNNVIIGAGSVVINDTPPDTTVVGVPARVVGPNRHPEYIQNRFNF